MRARDHARVWERARDLQFERANEYGNLNLHDEIVSTGLMALLCHDIAQAYREEAERNPE